jgi:pimeloyl-ACP methyl ester carboxylesterase
MGNGTNSVVFLHGLFGTPDHWRNIMTHLSDDYFVVAPQLPVDKYANERSESIQSVDGLVKYVVDLMLELELPPAVICGNSLGGLVAIEICLRYPERVAGLVLAGSAGLYERGLTSCVKPSPSREFVRSVASDIFADPSLITEQMEAEWYEAVLDRSFVRYLLRVSRATRNRRLDHELKRLKLPTLIVWGRDDKVTPPNVAESFQRQIQNAELRFIDNCGHAPNLEHPKLFAKLLQGFLPNCFPQESIAAS